MSDDIASEEERPCVSMSKNWRDIFSQMENATARIGVLLILQRQTGQVIQNLRYRRKGRIVG